jgi:flagellar P-ring protein precursor FlgI
VAVEESPASTMLLKSGDTIEDLIKALNAIKATPRDIIAILQAIKEAGGLHGNLEIL